MVIDIAFNVYSDSNGRDPDSASPTLRNYHKLLWSKALPNGENFELNDTIRGVYLCHRSNLGEYYLGSDAITHSYGNHKRKKWLTEQIHQDVKELFNAASTIGGYTLFPNNRVNGRNTINQDRGVNRFIDDRFDLTLECIRLFYMDQQSPLYETFTRYRGFFNLFESFGGYVRFFLLDDLVDDSGHIKFYLPFDNFKTTPTFKDINEYLVYKKGVMNFIQSRNHRIAKYASQHRLS